MTRAFKPSDFASDRLVGLSKPPTRDLLDGCNDPRAAWHTKDPHDFDRVWCQNCKNTECVRSKGSKTPWVDRMLHQPDYLINDPIFSDLLSHAHRVLAEQDFSQRNVQAERLEIADQRQDWSIPPEGAQITHPAPVADPPNFDDPPELLQEGVPEPATPLPPKPTPKPANQVRPGVFTNTPMPKGGLLLGPAPAPAPDPWTPTTHGTTVLPGARVILK